MLFIRWPPVLFPVFLVALKDLWHYRVFIGLKTYHCLATLVTCCLEDLTDVTLAFEDANSRPVDVVTVADVDGKKRVDVGTGLEAEAWS